MMKIRLLAGITAGVIVLTSCGSDTARVSEIAEQLLTTNSEITSVESHPSTTTLISNPTTTAAATAVINGTMTLGSLDHQSNANSTDCWGNGKFEGTSEGTDVVVRNGDGAVIGTSSLGAGVRIEHTEDFGNYSFWRCRFSFAVSVPADSPFYAIEVSHRTERPYSNAEMAAQNWRLSFSLD